MVVWSGLTLVMVVLLAGSGVILLLEFWVLSTRKVSRRKLSWNLASTACFITATTAIMAVEYAVRHRGELRFGLITLFVVAVVMGIFAHRHGRAIAMKEGVGNEKT